MATQETVWKPISMLEEGTYEVSNTGLVRRTACQIKTQSGVILNMPEKVVQPDSKDQYPMYRLVDTKGVRREFSAAELVARTFLENGDNKLVIKHKDGNPYNVWLIISNGATLTSPKSRKLLQALVLKAGMLLLLFALKQVNRILQKLNALRTQAYPRSVLIRLSTPAKAGTD